MLSAAILIPAVLNGLLMGAVYALVALGLTLIYGVLHIINFAHGALAECGTVRRVLRVQAARARPLRGAVPAGAALFRARLRAAAFRHRSGLARRRSQHVAGDARHRRHHRERTALQLSRRYPHDRCSLRLPDLQSRRDVPGGAARCRLCRGLRGGAGAVAADDASPISAAPFAPSPRRSSAPSWWGSTSPTSTR